MTQLNKMPPVHFYSGQLHNKMQEYTESLDKDEIFEVRKKLLREIRELEKLISLLKNREKK